MLHHWEEPCISGKRGSGAVFFSGCSLKCVFCQNQAISRTPVGTELSATELADLFLKLEDMGAHNVNLITPTHFVPDIIKALDIAKPKLSIPIVYNTSGYENIKTLEMLSGYVDVYLPDVKYFDKELSKKLSQAPDYFDKALDAVKEMYRQTGKFTEDKNRLAKRGVIIRHLVLPSYRHDSMKILEAVKSTLPIENVRLSLMSQFTPDFVPDTHKALKRKITSFEYQSVLDYAVSLGYTGYFQERDSASKNYTPAFPLS